MRTPRTTRRNFALLLAVLSACALRAAGRQAPAPDVRRLFLPGTERALDLDPGVLLTTPVEMEAEQIPYNDGRVREFILVPRPDRTKSDDFVFLMVRVEPERAQGGAAALRDFALAQRQKLKNFDKASARQSDYKQTPLLRYKLTGPGLGYLPGSPAVPLFPSLNLTSNAFEAYLAQDGVWVTLTILSRKLSEEEEKFFYSVLDSAKIVDASSPSTSFDYYTLGRELYGRKDWGGAARALEQALAQEQKRRELTRPQWEEMVRTLSDAEGAAGELPKARAALLYGLSAEPDNGHFHHALARVRAYLGDLDGALESLRLSYVNLPRELKSAGGWVPDPSDDAAFRRFKDDPKFKAALKAMKKQVKK